LWVLGGRSCARNFANSGSSQNFKYADWSVRLLADKKIGPLG
jgi:hypothetical protein